jgi:hypothetical protein
MISTVLMGLLTGRRTRGCAQDPTHGDDRPA